MNTRLQVAAQAAGITKSWVVDAIRRPRPRTPSDIPINIDALSPEWLTRVLCADVPGAEVRSFNCPGGSSGTSERAALRIEYNRAGREAGLPTLLFTKCSNSLRQRLLMGAADMLCGESDFYFHYRPKVDMEAPIGYWGAGDSRAGRSFLVLEDIAATKGARFVDAAESMSRPQVQDILANMAAYHGVWWDSPQLGRLKSTADHYRNVSGIIDMGGRCGIGLERAQDVIPRGFHDKADRLWEGTRRSLELLASQTPTLLHGDCHVGQTYVTSDDRMGLADWQLTMRGNWAFDVAYFIGSACEPPDRRAWEVELIGQYLEQLGAAGGRPPTFDDAFLAYRRSLFYPCAGWAGIIGRTWYQPNMQSDATMRAIVHRLSSAIDDLDSFEAIGV